MEAKYSCSYIKPVSTGPASESDVEHIKRHALPNSNLWAIALRSFDRPGSSYIAAQASRVAIADHIILNRLECALECRRLANPVLSLELVETSGGVLSPAPSGCYQADLYRRLRLPAILVGDPKLGGIGATLAAMESLHARGYDIAAIAMLEDPSIGSRDSRYVGNSSYLRTHSVYSSRIPVFQIPPPRHEKPDSVPGNPKSLEEDGEKMAAYYDCQAARMAADAFREGLVKTHLTRYAQLKSYHDESRNVLWQPFVQHATAPQPVFVDSAYQDFFHVFDPMRREVRLTQDGAVSSGTQGIGHGDPRLTAAAARASGRYGHVMAAGAIHEPGVMLASKLLELLGNPRLQRIFYSDNGSIAVEVALKMALWASAKRYGWSKADDIRVLALKDCYHGDTIGAMDTAEDCVFNHTTLWNSPKAVALDWPQVVFSKGFWLVKTADLFPESESDYDWQFSSLVELFQFDQRKAHAKLYQEWVSKILEHLVSEQGIKLGALIMEPVLQEAAGMVLVDPLFQHVLVDTIRNRGDFYPRSGEPASDSASARQEADTAADGKTRDWAGVPIISDEVFTGLGRLGVFHPSASLKAMPDISTHANLLTGGNVPLAITAASESIFRAFCGQEEAEALVHGHSYTAHPIGCNVALETLSIMSKTVSSGVGGTRGRRCAMSLSHQFSYSWEGDAWPSELVRKISYGDQVEHVVSIGTVLAIKLKEKTDGEGDKEAGDNPSTAAQELQARLLLQRPELMQGEWKGMEEFKHSDTKIKFYKPPVKTDPAPWSIHTRVLGPVIYFMLNLERLNRAEQVMLRVMQELGYEKRFDITYQEKVGRLVKKGENIYTGGVSTQRLAATKRRPRAACWTWTSRTGAEQLEQDQWNKKMQPFPKNFRKYKIH